jgi:response regulator of citrate/malate metabolism
MGAHNEKLEAKIEAYSERIEASQEKLEVKTEANQEKIDAITEHYNQVTRVKVMHLLLTSRAGLPMSYMKTIRD